MPASTSAFPQRFALRHVQLLRAAIAAIAALMITFSPDHSAAVGLSAFSGFAIANALVFFGAAWLTSRAGHRWAPVTVGALSLVAGMFAGVVPLRSTTLFFSVVIAWALATGLVELLVGLRERRDAVVRRADARDSGAVGALTVALGIALLFIPAQYALPYTVAEADTTLTLTGTIIAVGVFGGYAAIVAVYLAIAGLSPRESVPAPAAPGSARDRATVTATDAGAPTHAEGVL